MNSQVSRHKVNQGIHYLITQLNYILQVLAVLSRNPNLLSNEGSMHVEYHYSNHVVLVGGFEHAETEDGTKVGKTK